ncbi:glycosyltransferase [Candidatus Saccharibacteria bacterium]|nr:glycosyltransferase [Candidatus Saccharibacteria bacterium]
MRIAYFKCTSLEHGGGLEKYYIEVVSKLCESKNVHADVISLDDNFTDRITDAWSIFSLKRMDRKHSYKDNLEDVRRRLGKGKYYKAKNITELRQYLQDYDIVYSKNELLETFILKFFVKYKNVPPVVMGGHTPLVYPGATSKYAKLHNYLYTNSLYKFFASNVDSIHALNEYEENLYKQLFPKKKVYKIFNPFDTNSFKHDAVKYIHKNRAELLDDKINILYVGRFTEQKGIDRLVDVIDLVNSDATLRKKIRWVICGDGELRTLINDASTRHANVKYLGSVEPKYIAGVYEACQIHVCTSRWEGYPYVLLEPQAFGLKTFAYPIPGAIDILSSYEGGTLCNDSNAMAANIREYCQLSKDEMVRYKPSSQSNPKIVYEKILNMLMEVVKK